MPVSPKENNLVSLKAGQEIESSQQQKQNDTGAGFDRIRVAEKQRKAKVALQVKRLTQQQNM